MTYRTTDNCGKVFEKPAAYKNINASQSIIIELPWNRKLYFWIQEQYYDFIYYLSYLASFVVAPSDATSDATSDNECLSD